MENFPKCILITACFWYLRTLFVEGGKSFCMKSIRYVIKGLGKSYSTVQSGHRGPLMAKTHMHVACFPWLGVTCRTNEGRTPILGFGPDIMNIVPIFHLIVTLTKLWLVFMHVVGVLTFACWTMFMTRHYVFGDITDLLRQNNGSSGLLR